MFIYFTESAVGCEYLTKFTRYQVLDHNHCENKYDIVWMMIKDDEDDLIYINPKDCPHIRGDWVILSDFFVVGSLVIYDSKDHEHLRIGAHYPPYNPYPVNSDTWKDWNKGFNGQVGG